MGGHSGGLVEWSAVKDAQPFFGQIQLRGGKSNAQIKPIDRSLVEVPPYYPDVPFMRELWARHFDQARIIDREVDAIIKRLKDEGLYENTVLFIFSDHGWNNGLRHKQFCYEGGLHVPLAIHWPAQPEAIRAGVRRDDLVNGIDIPVTSMCLAGIPVPAHMEGRNLFADGYKRDFVIGARDRCDYTIDRIRTVRTDDFRYIRNGLTDRPYMQPQYRDGKDYTLSLKKLYAEGKLSPIQAPFFSDVRPAEELYDHRNDPHETQNLANDPKYAEELKKHRDILDQWIAESKDQGQQRECEAGLAATLKRWGDKCVNPEYEGITPEQ